MILAYNNETHYANHSKIIVLRKQRGPWLFPGEKVPAFSI